MSSRVVLLFLALAILIAGVCYVLFSQDSTEDEPTPAPRKGSTRDQPLELSPLPEETSGREAVSPVGSKLILSGQVIDKVSREPISPYFLRLLRKPYEDEKTTKGWIVVAEDMIREEEGRFWHEFEKDSHCLVWVTSSCYPRVMKDDVKITSEAGSRHVIIELDPGLSISGQVVDDSSGSPVSGAIVGSQKHSGSMFLYSGTKGWTEKTMHSKSDGEGKFTLYGLRKGKHKIGAVHSDYAEGWAWGTTEENNEIEIRLGKGHCVYGKVLDDRGEPCEGALITLRGGSLPLNLYATTGPNGQYRTPTAPLRVVQVNAGPPFGETEESFGLAEEERSVSIINQDVEVNFGPLPEHIEWRGTLYGYDGMPQAEARIQLETTGGRNRWERCDKEGRFVFRRLLIGSYDISLTLTDGSRLYKWKSVVFDEPGLLEEDIRLDRIGGAICGEISGFIVDVQTGSVPEKVRLAIHATNYAKGHKSYDGNVDEQGRFQIRGLPTGTYTIYGYGEGYPQKILPNIRVLEGEEVRDVCIELESGGELNIKLADFESWKSKSFEVLMYDVESGRQWHSEGRIGGDGNWEADYSKGAGEWIVGISFNDEFHAHRACSVEYGQISKVEFRQRDLISSETSVAVSGQLLRTDGTPCGGETLYFQSALRLFSNSSSSQSVRATTDSEGRFRVDGVAPGLCSVNLVTRRDIKLRLSDVFIPQDPLESVPLQLIVPAGTVSGVVCDELTGETLFSQGLKWNATVVEAETGKELATVQGGWASADFKVPGVPMGKCKLIVYAKGFERYSSEPFDHPGMGNVSLGKTALKRCGVLILEVVDKNGSPVNGFSTICNGKYLRQFSLENLPKNCREFYKLPLGEVSIEVRARGFSSAVKRVTLRPGQTENVRIELERE